MTNINKDIISEYEKILQQTQNDVANKNYIPPDIYSVNEVYKTASYGQNQKLYYGNNLINKIYYTSQIIKNVFLGNNKVF